MARKKKVVKKTHKPIMNGDIEVGSKIIVTLIDGYKVDIYGTVVYIHEKHFAFSYTGLDKENLAVAPLPKYMGKDNYYEVYEN